MPTEVEMLRKELHDHVAYCENRFAQTVAMDNQLLQGQRSLDDKLTSIAEDTATVREWTRNVQGAARLGAGVQNLGLWLIKWPLVGAGLYTAYKAMIKFLGELEG